MSDPPEEKRIKMSHTREGVSESSSDDDDDDVIPVLPFFMDEHGNINASRHVNLPLTSRQLIERIIEQEGIRPPRRQQSQEDLDAALDGLNYVPNESDASDSSSSSTSGRSSPPASNASNDTSNSSDYFQEFLTDFEHDIDYAPPEEYLKYDPTPSSPYPRPDWTIVNELQRRRFGHSIARHHLARRRPYHFEKHASYSLWMLQRLERSKVLDEHSGCVNCVDFNSSGDLLASCSDDLTVCIWDWNANKCRTKLMTGHSSNIYHCQFCDQNQSIVSCARDGTVRRCNIEQNISELLFKQNCEIAKLKFLTPQTFVTCGYSAEVNLIDLRTKSPTKLYTVREPTSGRRIMLNTIDAHPFENHRVVTAGMSRYVFVHDLRRVQSGSDDADLKQPVCSMENNKAESVVTSTAFNQIGNKLLASYNDDDLYVYSTETCEILKRYQGHRNSETIKGCCWFGDNFVLTGSDDGHIFGYEYDSRHIVCLLQGDEQGVVNSLVVHPELPVLASSGLDNSVKVWEPISQSWPQTLKGIKPVICRNMMRRVRSRAR